MSGFLNGSSASGSASGDLSGAYPSPVVVAIRGITVPTPSGSNTVLTYNAGAFSWGAGGGGGGGFTALTGDVTASGSGSVAATVVRLNGATIPAAGSLTTGNVLQVSGASAVTYGALNLGGGAGYITGTLPAGNQAAQSMAGAVGGTTAASTINLTGNASISGALPIANVAPGTSAQVLMSNGTPATTWTTFTGDVTISATGATSAVSLTGSSGTINIATSGNIFTWAAGTTAPGIAQTAAVSGAGANITIAPQAATTSGASGSLIVNVAAPASGTAEGAIVFERAGTILAQIQALVGNSAIAAIYLGLGATAPTATNFALSSAGTGVTLNAPGGNQTIGFSAAGTSYMTCTSATLTMASTTNIAWAVGNTPNISQLTRTSDAAINAFTIQAQSAFATASTNITGGNLVLKPGAGATSNATFTSGNVIANINAPNSGGTEAYFQVQRAGTNLAALGAEQGSSTTGALYLGLGATAPTNANYVLACSGTSLVVNAPSAGVIIDVGGALVAEFTGSAIQMQTNCTTLEWLSTTASPSFIQVTRGSDLATQALTIQAQNAFATASTNVTGGNLVLQAGAGATSNATYSSGSITAAINAQSGATQAGEAYFNIDRGLGTHLFQIGANIGDGATFAAMWAAGATPAVGNYVFMSNSANTYIQGSTEVNISGGGSSCYTAISGRNSFLTPVAGLSANNAFSWANFSVALTSGASNVLTSSQYYAPRLKFTGTLTGSGTTITFPSTEGAFWICDFDGVTFSSNTISIIANGNTWGTTISALTTVVLLYYIASEGKLYGVSLSA